MVAELQQKVAQYKGHVEALEATLKNQSAMLDQQSHTIAMLQDQLIVAEQMGGLPLPMPDVGGLACWNCGQDESSHGTPLMLQEIEGDAMSFDLTRSDSTPSLSPYTLGEEPVIGDDFYM